MSGFPCLVWSVSGLGEVRYSLGDRLVDRYLEFLAAWARPNTLRAGAFDLKAFFCGAGGGNVDLRGLAGRGGCVADLRGWILIRAHR
jgi:hypothetical protein